MYHVRKLKVFLSILFALLITGCQDSSIFYGEYVFDQIIYLSPELSSSIEKEAAILQEKQFIIQKDMFTIQDSISITNPIYQKEDFSSAIFDKKTTFWQSENFQEQYLILMEQGEETGHVLYLGQDRIYVAVCTFENGHPQSLQMVYRIKQ